ATRRSQPGGGDVLMRVSHFALLAGLCQFIPIPFADDLAGQNVRRRMVGVLLDRRGRTYDVDDVEPLYAGPGKSLVGRAGSFAKGLVLKPMKKLLRTVFFVAIIRQAILATAEVLMLGHTIDRLLAQDWLPNDAPKETLEAEAEQIVVAVSGVMSSPERRGLVTLVRRMARVLRDRDRSDTDLPDVTDGDAEAALDDGQRRDLDTASAKLANRLEDETGRSILARVDAAVDARLAKLNA
ncbi:MAG: hypothetical protein AAF561_12960, partial [Planctomycetota bacterium]